MQKLISYPLTALYFLSFGLSLIIFHPIQWVCYNVFGYTAHKKSVSLLNWFLMRSTHFLGTHYSFRKEAKIPTDKPIIFVANHQSMNDIPPLIWFFRKNHPKFVSKKELGKGIPSVSYNLRHGGSILIDRKDARQALTEIAKLGKYIEKHNRSAVIFPEGTRSRTGHPKRFQPMGLKILIKNAPSALIVPISINNSWKLLKYGKYPYGLGSHFTIDVHTPIETNSNVDDIIAQVEQTVTTGVTSFK